MIGGEQTHLIDRGRSCRSVRRPSRRVAGDDAQGLFARFAFDQPEVELIFTVNHLQYAYFLGYQPSRAGAAESGFSKEGAAGRVFSESGGGVRLPSPVLALSTPRTVR